MARKAVRTAVIGFAATALAATGFVASEQPASAVSSKCYSGRVVCVSKAERKIRWMINGRTQFSMSARFGAARTPTRNGTFYIYWKDIDHVSSLYGSAMPFSMFFSGGQAIHYSSDFARRGYAGASHGCVNTRDYGLTRTLYNATRIGDKVVVY